MNWQLLQTLLFYTKHHLLSTFNSKLQSIYHSSSPLGCKPKLTIIKWFRKWLLRKCFSLFFDSTKHGMSKVPLAKRRDDTNNKFSSRFWSGTYFSCSRYNCPTRYTYRQPNHPQFICHVTSFIRVNWNYLIQNIQVKNLKNRQMF